MPDGQPKFERTLLRGKAWSDYLGLHIRAIALGVLSITLKSGMPDRPYYDLSIEEYFQGLAAVLFGGYSIWTFLFITEIAKAYLFRFVPVEAVRLIRVLVPLSLYFVYIVLFLAVGTALYEIIDVQYNNQ